MVWCLQLADGVPDVFFTMVRCGRVLEATFDFAIERAAKEDKNDIKLVMDNGLRIWKRVGSLF